MTDTTPPTHQQQQLTEAERAYYALVDALGQDEDEAQHAHDAVMPFLRRAWDAGYFNGAMDERDDPGGKSKTANPFGCAIPTFLAARGADAAVTDGRLRAARDKGLDEYLRTMDRHGESEVYTADFRDGFRHALAMLAAYESEGVEGRVRPEVSVAARLALARRAALDAAPAPTVDLTDVGAGEERRASATPLIDRLKAKGATR